MRYLLILLLFMLSQKELYSREISFTEEYDSVLNKVPTVGVVINGGLVPAQSCPADKEILGMLQRFYTNYIRTFNRYPTDEKKLDPLLKANCEPGLLARLKKKAEAGDLDYDPFLKAQDVDMEWLKTLLVSKVAKKEDQYAVSYVDNADKSTVVIHLVVNRVNGALKIREVLLD